MEKIVSDSQRLIISILRLLLPGVFLVVVFILAYPTRAITKQLLAQQPYMLLVLASVFGMILYGVHRAAMTFVETFLFMTPITAVSSKSSPWGWRAFERWSDFIKVRYNEVNGSGYLHDQLNWRWSIAHSTAMVGEIVIVFGFVHESETVFSENEIMVKVIGGIILGLAAWSMLALYRLEKHLDY